MPGFINWKVRCGMVEVLKAGFYTTIQDFGRFGFQRYGVPYSGVMDRYAAGFANSILGNKVGAAVLEMTMTGATLRFDCDAIISIAGADMLPHRNEKSLPLYKAVKINKGDVLSFGKCITGFRCYLAVLGGFKTQGLMHSQSMCKGITDVFFISKNQTLEIGINNSFSITKSAYVKVKIDYINTSNLNVFKGPEFDYLSKSQQEFLLKNQFVISKEHNRMAYQLEGVMENQLKPIITSAVLPGTVQLTPSGTLIVLMRDCQTTGGYPRVLQLADASINTLSQKFTGEPVHFTLSEF